VPLFVGGYLPWRRRERRRQLQPPLPNGNRHMRRLLNQAANAAARARGSIFEIVYRRSVSRLGHNQAIGAIAHRQCRLIWLILHQGVRYQERGPAVTKQSRQKRTWRMIRQLRNLGYRIELPRPNPKGSVPYEGISPVSSLPRNLPDSFELADRIGLLFVGELPSGNFIPFMWHVSSDLVQ
jgi:hypothetical protein